MSAPICAGVWFLGVFVNGDECVSHDLQLVRSACPNGCSGESRGTCAADTGTCTCKVIMPEACSPLSELENAKHLLSCSTANAT